MCRVDGALRLAQPRHRLCPPIPGSSAHRSDAIHRSAAPPPGQPPRQPLSPLRLSRYHASSSSSPAAPRVRITLVRTVCALAHLAKFFTRSRTKCRSRTRDRKVQSCRGGGA
eukprot:1763913-Rhodomonas_salina.1